MKWLLKHTAKLLVMLVLFIPLVGLALWVSSFDIAKIESTVDGAWAVGTVFRVCLYYLVIDIFFIGRTSSNLATCETRKAELDDIIASWDSLDAHDEETATEKDQVLYEREAVGQRSLNLKNASALQPTLWTGVLITEALLQAVFFWGLR